MNAQNSFILENGIIRLLFLKEIKFHLPYWKGEVQCNCAGSYISTGIEKNTELSCFVSVYLD